MKIYYAHAICLYGTKHERDEKSRIKKRFPKAKIIDPGSYENNLEKFIGGMNYCLELVDKCDVLVFTRLLGKITAGVGKEINYALSKKKKVFELINDNFIKVSKPVTYLSRLNTILLYEKWRNEKSS